MADARDAAQPEEQGGGGEGKPQRRRRRRDLLKMYYGEQSSAQAKGNPLDINEGDFQPQKYLNKLYGTYDLPRLIKREDELARQIKSLDSDMQTLVYENYNKFISATETIRRMKSQVEDMEGEMQKLSENMDSITQLSDGINVTLAPKRERVRKLGDGHILLKKLQFLFELPARLAQCVEMEAYAQAVSYYCKASGVLHQYREMSSFKPIHDECTEIIQNLTATLNARVEAEDVKQDVMIETFGLLMRLTDDPAPLFDTLLAKAKVQWDADTEEQRTFLTKPPDAAVPAPAPAEAVPTDAAEEEEATSPNADAQVPEEAAAATSEDATVAEGSVADGDHPLVACLQFGNATTLCNLAEWVIAYMDVFIPEGILGSQSESPTRPGTAAETVLSPTQRARKRTAEAALSKLEEFVSGILAAYLQESTGQVRAAVDSLTSVDVVIAALETLFVGFQRMDSLLPDCNCEELAIEVCVQAIRHLCRHRGRYLREAFRGEVEQIGKKLGNAEGLTPAAGLKQLTASVMSSMEHTLQYLARVPSSKFARYHHYFATEFSRKNVRIDITQALLAFIGDQITATATSAAAEQSPALLLVLARLGHDFEQHHVLKLSTQTASVFSQGEIQGPGDLSDADMLAVAQNQKNLATSAKVALRQFVFLSASSLATGIEADLAAEDWLTVAAPTAVRAGITGLVRSLETTHAQVQTLFPSKAQRHSGSMRTLNGTQSNVQKLFLERIEIFQCTPLTANGAMTGILRILFKTFSELARLCAFSTHGYQQIEVDLNFLYRYAAQHAADEDTEASIHTLLQQILFSVGNRCQAPVPCDPAIVENLCGAA